MKTEHANRLMRAAQAILASADTQGQIRLDESGSLICGLRDAVRACASAERAGVSGAPQGAEHFAIAAFEGFAGEFRDWDNEYVRVILRIKRDDGLKLEDAGPVRLRW
ncbi:hypothetical protein [Thioalkalivibrio thiocyanodenitrificans]|uniref:hypothetical protein n=1 Tax=Thioalkalivibrio thiocyanodenitrificans TaxID=243063 RepID=UPI0003A05032|nr:hypothetical protein [Thioalkalivibrio thiocyanodenitrificans]